jgi:cytochrome c553
MNHLRHSSSIFVIISLLVALILAACGGNSAPAIPTQTIIPTYNFLTPTPFAAIETAVATTAEDVTAEATAGLDPEVVARGKARYDALACATCHGENGEGTDKAKPLTTFTMSQGDFVTFMRSGGKIGPTHQYATNRLSITGGAALYQYLLSIQKSL